jgi:hypothetical protein
VKNIGDGNVNRLACGSNREGATRGSKGAGLNFILSLQGFVEKALSGIGVAWRMAHRGLGGWGHKQASRRSAGNGLPLFLGFSGDRPFHGGARIRKTWRRGNDFGPGRLGFREQSGGRVDQRADHFGGRHGRGLQGFMVIEHPSGEDGFGRLLDPLIDQSSNFLTQIGRVIEPRQFKTLQRGARSRLQIIERRGKPRNGHDQSSDLWAGPKGPPVKLLVHSTELSRYVSSPSLWICCG